MNEQAGDVRKRCIAVLRQLQDCYDTESAHIEADEALCGLLIELGYQDVVEEYNKVRKWYA